MFPTGAVNSISILQTLLLTFAALTNAPVRVAAQGGTRRAPVRPPSSAPPSQPQPVRASFRVILTGLCVHHESDDDIFEGDGRGDEIFITAHVWQIESDRDDALPVGQLKTRVMGDTRGHPERVLAGSGTPNPNRMNEGSDCAANSRPMLGGLRTGDYFPPDDNQTLMTDRPPFLLWQGELIQRQSAVVILPFVWEWDSDDRSVSQRNIAERLPVWMLNQRRRVQVLISTPPSDETVLYQPPDEILLDGKAGTRPIGYAGGAGAHDPQDHIVPQALVLTYEIASHSAQAVTRGVKGLFEIRYRDDHDHGDYSLYLRIEQVFSLRQTIQQRQRP